jgi:hypothetical protein
MPPRPLGPAPAPGSLLPPNEKLPSSEAFCLKGHEGPVLAVRFNALGTYCMSCGKVRAGFAAAACSMQCHAALSHPVGSRGGCRIAACGCGTPTVASPSRSTPATATTCGMLPWLRTTASASAAAALQHWFQPQLPAHGNHQPPPLVQVCLLRRRPSGVSVGRVHRQHHPQVQGPRRLHQHGECRLRGPGSPGEDPLAGSLLEQRRMHSPG